MQPELEGLRHALAAVQANIPPSEEPTSWGADPTLVRVKMIPQIEILSTTLEIRQSKRNKGEFATLAKN